MRYQSISARRGCWKAFILPLDIIRLHFSYSKIASVIGVESGIHVFIQHHNVSECHYGASQALYYLRQVSVEIASILTWAEDLMRGDYTESFAGHKVTLLYEKGRRGAMRSPY